MFSTSFRRQATSQGRSRGFTLIELLIVVAIIGLLSTLAVVALANSRKKARVAGMVANLRQITTILQLYASANNGTYPCFDHVVSDAKEVAWAAPYGEWPRNPAGVAPNDYFHWEHGFSGISGAPYSISMLGLGAEYAQALDTAMDDGVLTTGLVRGSGTRMEFMGFDQTIPYAHCHN